MSYRMILIFGFLLLDVCLLANNPQDLYHTEAIKQRNFEETRWEEAKAGIDYSADQKKVRKKQEKEADARPQQGERRRNSPQVSFGDGTAATILKFLIILAGIVILALILKSLLGLGTIPKNKKIESGENDIKAQIEQIEDNLYERDLGYYIQQALDNQNFNLAVRLYFLAILKELSLKKRIKWKKDKTNQAYLLEMSQEQDFDTFRNITQIFERIWYGNLRLTQNDFVQIESQFKQYLQSISFQTT